MKYFNSCYCIPQKIGYKMFICLNEFNSNKYFDNAVINAINKNNNN